MDFYSWLRAFADSWVLLAMTAFYLGVFVWVVRPGSNRVHADIAEIPLRNEYLEPAAPKAESAKAQVAGRLPEERK